MPRMQQVRWLSWLSWPRQARPGPLSAPDQFAFSGLLGRPWGMLFFPHVCVSEPAPNQRRPPPLPPVWAAIFGLGRRPEAAGGGGGSAAGRLSWLTLPLRLPL